MPEIAITACGGAVGRYTATLTESAPRASFKHESPMSEPRTVTKRELILRLAETGNHQQTLVRDIIQAFIDEITAELGRGNRVELRDFAVFDTRKRRARRARNPRTGEFVDVPERVVISVKAGKKMRDKIVADIAAAQGPAGPS
jgi:integration host factor subunit beta